MAVNKSALLCLSIRPVRRPSILRLRCFLRADHHHHHHHHHRGTNGKPFNRFIISGRSRRRSEAPPSSLSEHDAVVRLGQTVEGRGGRGRTRRRSVAAGARKEARNFKGNLRRDDSGDSGAAALRWPLSRSSRSRRRPLWSPPPFTIWTRARAATAATAEEEEEEEFGVA